MPHIMRQAKMVYYLCSMKFRLIAISFLIVFIPLTGHAASIGFVTSSGVTFSSEQIFAGIAVKVFSIVVNNQYQKLSAVVAFSDNGIEIGRTTAEIPIEEARQVQIQWTPAFGNHNVVAKFISADGTDLQGAIHQLTTAELDSVATPVSRTISVDTDSDHDGIADHEEISTYHTSPTLADSDGDGLSDYQEIFTYHTDPNKADTDTDGTNDGAEIIAHRNPLVADAPIPPPPPASQSSGGSSFSGSNSGAGSNGVLVSLKTNGDLIQAANKQKHAPTQIFNVAPPVVPNLNSIGGTSEKKIKKPLTSHAILALNETKDSLSLPTTNTSTPEITTISEVATTNTTTTKEIENVPLKKNIPENSDTNWAKVLGIIAGLFGVAAAVSGTLAYREQNKYRR